MKKFTLFLFAAVAALCSFAQTTGDHGELIGQYGAIYGMPEGAPTRTYSLMGTKAIYEEGDAEQGIEAGIYTLDVVRNIEIVEFEDGTMFFKDLVTDAAYGSYVKGTRIFDEDGEAEFVRIPVGQILAHDKNSDSNILLMRFNFVDDEEASDIVNCTDDLVFSVTKSGDSEILTEINDQIYYNFYGAMLDNAAQNIVAIGDAAVTMTYNASSGENDEMLSMPEGVATKTYNCHAYSYAQSTAYNEDKYVDYDVEIARVGDDVYLKGLYFYQNPDAINPISNVLKGKFVDGEVVFPQHQYIGIDGRGADIYVVAMGTSEDGYYFEARDSWSLVYDAENDTYDGGASIVRFNPIPFYKTGVYAYESIDEIFLTAKDNEGINTVLAPAAEGRIYDLQGRKISNATKGLYIVDGKKVVR
ncbi:MAG: hypothetical protein Q4D23_04070 [Bacteroidales bacterium]|nr:hypothetical protein [Bacteroidales bacterium]